jgi:hypothetical protein
MKRFMEDEMSYETPPNTVGTSTQDITTRILKWDEYREKQPQEALSSIYTYITSSSKQICGWYWENISKKRIISLAARGLSFFLFVAGTALQIYATTLEKAPDKLNLTQLAVAFLAVAALVLLGDRAFGWSSGWMRYITTVTTMENLTRSFQLEWAKYLVSKTTPLDAADTKALFDLARGLEQELLKLQADETTKWIAEFSAGISLLESAIKTQREETEKKIDAIRTTLASQEVASKAEEKSRASGSVEVALSFKADVKKVQITFGRNEPVDFLGTSWTKLDVAPGQHSLRVKTLTDPPQHVEKIIEVQPAAVTRTEVKIAV